MSDSPDRPTPDTPPAAAAGEPTADEQLKAERIQEPLAAALFSVIERLKAERIQEELAAAGLPITKKLEAAYVHQALRALPEWQLTADGKAIRRSWPVPSLWTGTALASRHATIIEAHRHTATVTITATAVEVALSTPAAGGLTARDLAVAAALEA